jgi:hypothetical protein
MQNLKLQTPRKCQFLHTCHQRERVVQSQIHFSIYYNNHTNDKSPQTQTHTLTARSLNKQYAKWRRWSWEDAYYYTE